MAPPAKGTPEYVKYLEKQKVRRQRQRALASSDKRQAAARPYVCAAVRNATKEIEKQKNIEVQRKNQLLRENQRLKYANKQLLDANIALEKKLQKATEVIDSLRAKVTSAERKVQSLQQDRSTLRSLLTKWEVWWQRVQQRAGQALLSKLHWLSRPPRAAPDACWGGGQ